MLPVLRLDRLGPVGDTLFCLVHGEAYRIDVHEAPELLHYGIDEYTPPASQGQAPAAVKQLRTFTRAQDGAVTIGSNTVAVQVGSSFRTRSPRVLRLADLATALATANEGRPDRLRRDGIRDDRRSRHGQLRERKRVMKAIIPLNVAALRVSSTDSTNVTPRSGFDGRTAAFDLLPHGPQADQASTGDTVWIPLGNGSPSEPLETGVHLHWELPEFFKRGQADQDLGSITFPPAPTRWLVARSLSLYDQDGKSYGAPRQASWVVESDYVSAQLLPDQDGITRPAISVPLTAPNGNPYMFMGRVVNAASWNPASENPADYLPHYTGPNGKPLSLTSIGFTGAAFSGYYPDCRSVFGFWDTFADVSDVYAAVTGNNAIKFRVSYTVIGWLPDAANDPLNGLAAAVTSKYNQYVNAATADQAKVVSTPADTFASITSNQYGWQFSGNAISYTQDDNTHLLTSLNVPDGTLCAGVIQEVVWDQSTAHPFLASATQGQPWTDQVEIAIGNTTVEAASALVKSHLAAPGDGSNDAVLASYETLLNALQLGVLRDLEGQGNALATLEQTLHERAFSQIDGGHQWTIQTKAAPGSQASIALTLPLTLAEQLAALNNAQLAYDQARSRLVAARQQLFMDWVIYVKQLCRKPQGTYVVPTNTLGAFLATSGSGELRAVTNAGAAAGLLHYQTDPKTGRIIDVTADGATTALAGQVVSAYQAVTTALNALAQNWELDAVPAAPFWLPTDPVLVVEGNRLEPVRRNGPTTAINVRADSELISALQIGGGPGSWTVQSASVHGLPAPPTTLAALPQGAAAAAAIAEAALLDPQYAAAVAAATGSSDAATLSAAIAGCQGGQSPLDPPVAPGLFGAVHTAGYARTADPAQSVQAPAQLTVTFTNAAKTALPPDAVGWNTQTALPEFSASRVDPFLPVWMTWEMRVDPLARDSSRSSDPNKNYAPGALADQFILGTDEIDLSYQPPATFTTGQPVTYSGTVVLSKKPFVSLTEQINLYLTEFPGDEADTELTNALNDLAGRKVMSQALDTFGSSQTLRTTIPQIAVQNLVTVSPPDAITKAIASAAIATPGDSWYDTNFNALTAISTGPQSQYNYGPLRSGFAELRRLSIVDTFGQVMNLTTATTPSSGALPMTTAADMSPASGDMANAGKAYLPPRVLAPSRVDAHWLSASYDPSVPGFTADFAETNDHPATSPVCGWIVPNHLDVSLAFYDADGTAIGSFGIEHGDSRYRTWAGNPANPGSDLNTDLSKGVNPNVAALMRFVAAQPAGFLTDLMGAIENSDKFINPASFGQDAALSVLIGLPLAIVRMVQSISTSGGVLPASQGDNTAADALTQAVTGKLYDFGGRQARTTAGLAQVQIPVRLGELTDIDDGMVAFLPEPYSVVYAATAPDNGANHVVQPGADTIELTLNGPALTFTAIVDPRAPVHVSTGVLPTATLQIPADQYLNAMRQLAVTFTTRPVLRDQFGLRIPLPAEAGFTWSWVSQGSALEPLSPASAPDVPSYGYSPQQLREGWLDLIPNPAQPSNGSQ